MPPDLLQLGVAGVIAAMLIYILKLILDGRLHTDSEIAVRDKQISERDERIRDLLKQNETLAVSLAAANEQARAIISIWKALGSDHEDS